MLFLIKSIGLISYQRYVLGVGVISVITDILKMKN